MKFPAALDKALAILSEAHVALLSTIGEDGYPRSRWMTPTPLPRLKGRLYAVTSRRFAKAREIAAEPRVTWIVQERTLDIVVELAGRAEIIDDPAFAAEVVKSIGPRLEVFWRESREPRDLVVVETVVESIRFLYPLSGERESAEAANG
ncbi:MAG: pyridoxamine 5'-phosphate oxidase family protein [Spirochaetaceae bacterium]|nr:pyridoxamine 5'-phosphate oxidase family protein [Spirochaetaceae bacterium]